MFYFLGARHLRCRLCGRAPFKVGTRPPLRPSYGKLAIKYTSYGSSRVFYCSFVTTQKVANNPGSCEEWYLGDETDGVRHGHGAAFFTSGDVYLGQVLVVLARRIIFGIGVLRRPCSSPPLHPLSSFPTPLGVSAFFCLPPMSASRSVLRYRVYGITIPPPPTSLHSLPLPNRNLVRRKQTKFHNS